MELKLYFMYLIVFALGIIIPYLTQHALIQIDRYLISILKWFFQVKRMQFIKRMNGMLHKYKDHHVLFRQTIKQHTNTHIKWLFTCSAVHWSASKLNRSSFSRCRYLFLCLWWFSFTPPDDCCSNWNNMNTF